MKKRFNLDDFDLDFRLKIIDKPRVLQPSDIVNELNDYVVGQEAAKKALAVTIVNHDIISKHNKQFPKDGLRRTNLLMCGASGMGKTYLIESVAKILDKDVLVIDATEFTQSGYVGRDVSEILTDLLYKCDADKERIENAIVVIDEIDKIGTFSTDADVNTTGVQRSLLKLIEGTEKRAFTDGSRRAASEGMTLDTSNILWILCGAFTSFIEDKEEDKTTIGFGKSTKVKEKFTMSHEDLIDAGFMREFVGRIGNIVHLDKLTKEQYKDILVKPKNSVCKQYKKLGELRKINLTLTDAELDNVVEEAMKLGTGARGLKILVEEKLFGRMYT